MKLKPFVMIGIALVAIAGALLWYGARPKWHQAWNPKAIQATYVGKSFGSTDSGDMPSSFVPNTPYESYVKLAFDLRNITSSDYTLEGHPSDTTIVMQRVRGENGLVGETRLSWTIANGPGEVEKIVPLDKPPLSIFIPAGHTVRVDFWYLLETREIAAALDKNEKLQPSNQIQRERILRRIFKDTESLILPDKLNHYWIELPLQDAAKD